MSEPETSVVLLGHMAFNAVIPFLLHHGELHRMEAVEVEEVGMAKLATPH